MTPTRRDREIETQDALARRYFRALLAITPRAVQDAPCFGYGRGGVAYVLFREGVALSRADYLAGAGVNVKFISNQPADSSVELARLLALPAHFEILFDRDLHAARALSIVDEGGTMIAALRKGFPRDTVMATVVALDERNRVIFGDESHNYRRRPHPDTFLPVFGPAVARA